MKKILFICHDSNRTGAPLLLLDFMKWLKYNTLIEFDVLLLKEGGLESEFSKLSTVYLWKASEPVLPNILIRLFRRITRNYPDHENEYKKNLFEKFQRAKYDLIYGNTVVSTPLVKELFDFLKLPVIVHIHELYGITQYFNKALEELVDIPSLKFIAGSKINFRNLVDNHFIPEEKIDLIYAFIDVEKWRCVNFEKAHTERFVISSSGLVQIRKGAELFILIAKRSFDKYPEIPWLFNWIGQIDRDSRYYYESDISKFGLSGSVCFKGQFENPESIYSTSDVFLMVSKEEAWGLVCIEHAVLGKPIVCFDKGTGITEFVEQGTGVIVKYMDIEAVVDALATLYNDKELYTRFSEKAKVLVKDYDIEIQAKKIVDLIENACKI